MSDTPTPPRRKWAASPWLISLLAVLELVLGFILLSFPFLLGASAVWVGGFVLCIAAILRLIQFFSNAVNRWWNLLAAFLYFGAGILMMYQTGASLAIITLFIGVTLIVVGIMRLAVAFSLRHSEGNVWRFFNAVISLLLGGLVVYSWPGSALWLLGTIIAIEMIFSGWTLLFLALPPKRQQP